jgi:4-oxalocrotonate tautomerase
MPIVQISVWEGLSSENKKKIFEALTKVFEEMEIPKEAVQIVIYESPKTNWATGEQLHSDRYPHIPSVEKKEDLTVESNYSKMRNEITSPSTAKSISNTSMQNREFEEALLRAKELNPPVDEELNPPVDEELNPPVDEELNPPVDEELNPPVDEELNPPVNETAILENERGTKLYNDRLIHEGKTYLITEMKYASTKAGFIHSLLQIQFKNGETHSFYVGNLPNMSITNANFKGFKIDYSKTDFKEAAELWASVINALISLN